MTETNSKLEKKINNEIQNNADEVNRIPVNILCKTENFQIIPRKYSKKQLFIANVNVIENNLSSILQNVRAYIRPKNNLKVQDIGGNKIKDITNRLLENEPKIISFIDFIKTDLREKEKLNHLHKHYQSIFKDFNDDQREESSISNKKNFEDNFSEILHIQNNMKNEFNREIPLNDNLLKLVKGAKDEFRTAYNNKNDRIEAQDKYKSLGDSFKKLEAKIRVYVDLLKKSICYLTIDKKFLLEEEFNVTMKKIDEEIPILNNKCLKNIDSQAKIYSKTGKKIFDLESNGNIPCSLRSLLDQTILFLEEVKKKIVDLKGSSIYNNLMFKIEKLNSENNENIMRLDELGFFNTKKSEEIINAFNLFILTLKQNSILLTRILNISEVFYNRKLENVFDKKFTCIEQKIGTEKLYRMKYEKVYRPKSTPNKQTNMNSKN